MSRAKLKPIKDQVIFITGASSGIGLATALMAAEQGAKVALVSRNLKDLNKIVKEIKVKGGTAIAIEADVADLGEMQVAADLTIKEFGTIDTWVNNAGVSIYGKLLDLDEKEEKRLFDVNFWGIRNGCHVAIPILRKKGGTLINLGSEVSERAIPLQGLYSASKHAVKAYTEALRVELDHDEVPVNVTLVRPTAINTPFPMHALNKLEQGSPKLPQPAYDPSIVATAILDAAQYYHRDVYVGGPSKFQAVLEAVSPYIADALSAKGFKDQVGRKNSSKEDQGLTRVSKKEGEIHGSIPLDDEKKTSAYTTLSTHPLSTIAATAVIGAGAMLASRYLRK